MTGTNIVQAAADRLRRVAVEDLVCTAISCSNASNDAMLSCCLKPIRALHLPSHALINNLVICNVVIYG